MSISSLNEQLIPLSHVPAWLARQGTGITKHVATIHRWATHGIGGRKLECVQVGGTRCTTPQALARFFQRRVTTSSINPDHPQSGQVLRDISLSSTGGRHMEYGVVKNEQAPVNNMVAAKVRERSNRSELA